MTEFRWKVSGLIGAGTLLVILPLVLPSYWLTILTQMLIFAILAMSLDLLAGYTGLPSFGHAAFFGISAYAVAILTTRYQVGFLGSLGAGILFSLAVAALFGLLSVHSGGVYFLMITLALGMVVWGLAFRWVTMTGGDNGIAGIPRPEFSDAISFWDPIPFYYLVFFVFLVALVLMFVFIRSPFGQTLLGIRESESRMRTLGYNIWLHKYLSYIVAGVFSGVSGTLWAYYNGFVSPEDVTLTASFEVFLMVILGGPGTLVGPALGAGIIVFLKNYLSSAVPEILPSLQGAGWLTIMGSIYILTILFAPKGLLALWIHLVKRGGKEENQEPGQKTGPG